MPCWTVRTTTLKLAVADMALMTKALGNEFKVPITRIGTKRVSFFLPGMSRPIVVNGEAGEIAIPEGEEAIISRIKVAYSREAVKQAATRFGWQAMVAAPNKLSVSRRF